jgi:hypothetical protein
LAPGDGEEALFIYAEGCEGVVALFIICEEGGVEQVYWVNGATGEFGKVFGVREDALRCGVTADSVRFFHLKAGLGEGLSEVAAEQHWVYSSPTEYGPELPNFAEGFFQDDVAIWRVVGD